MFDAALFQTKNKQELTDDNALDRVPASEFWLLSLSIACFLALGS